MSKGAGIQTLSLITSRNEGYHTRIALTGDVHERELDRLTQYSHGAGCGCKISPKVLETILHSEQAKFVDPNLLVGNETRDDAAVYDLGNGTSVISTTDFFMPIVDNPFDFALAPTNAISDIFAMGANRLWRLRPRAAVNKLPRKLPAK